MSKNSNMNKISNKAPGHTPIAESRDPIMEDDHFSLRFGNPIQEIHDAAIHKIDNFEPTKNHVPGILADTLSGGSSGSDTLQEEEKKKQLPRTNSGYLRDIATCSEFYHGKNGTVSEV